MKYVPAMREVIKKAALVIMQNFRGNFEIKYKNNRSIQTQVDIDSQKILQHGLQAMIQGSGFIAEESAVIDLQEFTWVIDPIDGTKNFSRGLPYFGINVALMHYNQVIACVTYVPCMDDWFYAELGHGAWLNDKQLLLTAEHRQDYGCLIVVPSFRLQQPDFVVNIKQELRYIPRGIAFRVFGAAAIDLAYTACGAFDAVLFENLSWWDAAAGVLLIQEAGGWVTQYDGRDIDRSFTSLIAGNREICNRLIHHLHD